MMDTALLAISISHMVLAKRDIPNNCKITISHSRNSLIALQLIESPARIPSLYSLLMKVITSSVMRRLLRDATA
jgi:hypothetical protein